jgi:hypothetical protein
MIKTLISVLAFLGTAIAAHAQGVWLGGGLPVQTMSVENATRLYCRISAYHQTVADLAPGETIFNGRDQKPAKKPHGFGKFFSVQIHRGNGVGWYMGSASIDMPVVALCYTDAIHQTYVGAASMVFNIVGAGLSTSYHWVIGPEDIRPADDAPEVPENAGHFISRGVEFPKVTAEGMGIQIIVWNSPSAAHLTMNGQDEGYLREGEMYYLAARNPVTITLTAPGAGGRFRTRSQTTMNQDFSGVRAQVYILGTRDLR